MDIRSKAWPLYRQRLAQSNLPILVGPWRGEVGFEALYWIPFVRRFAKTYGIDPARLIPISRGGAAVWYGMPAGVELYAMRTPKDIRIENRVQHAKHRMLKQIQWTPFDRQVIRDTAETLGLKRYLTLHPSWMFARFESFFASGMSLAALEQQALYDPLTVPAIPDGLQLPDRFVAVRFYLRHTFPNHPSLVAFARESIKQIASHTPVVLLNVGVHADEHADVTITNVPNVYSLADLGVETDTNLAVQSAVIARSLGFVGTYGGLAQLALRIGKPTVSYYAEWGGTAMAHKHLADALALRAGLPCIVQRVGEIPLLQQITPMVQG